MSVNTRHAYGRVTEQVSNVPFVNAIGSQTRGEGSDRLMLLDLEAVGARTLVLYFRPWSSKN